MFSPQSYDESYLQSLSKISYSINYQNFSNQNKTNQSLNLKENETIEECKSNKYILRYSKITASNSETPNSKSKNKTGKNSEKKILKNIFSNMNNMSKTLRVISFHDCMLQKIPQELYNLPKHVISLDLSLNFIKVLPNEVKWNKLKGLNLRCNSFNKWPNILEPEKFTKLTYLSLGFNEIKSIPEFQTSFEDLQYLDLSFTSLKNLPEWISKCNRLVTLKLRGNNLLSSFSFKMISPMRTLRILDISKIEIPKDEKSIKLPNTLELLISRENDRSDIPDGLFVFKN